MSFYENITSSFKRSAAMSVAALGLALVLMSSSFIKVPFVNFICSVVGLLVFMAGTTLELYRYLQDVRRRSPGLKYDRVLRSELQNQAEKISSLEVSIFYLTKQNEELSNQPQLHVDAVSEEILNIALEKAKNLSSEKLTADVIEGIKNSNKINEQLERARSSVLDAVGSLEEEIEALSRRSSVQMAAGAVVSVIGFGVLGFFIYRLGFELAASGPDLKMAYHVLMRISLVTMIELFAFFFLRMYRYSIFEIKYYQNEISNFHLKSIAVDLAIYNPVKNSVELLIKELIVSERNVLLKKGEVSLSQLRDIAERGGDEVLVNFIKTAPGGIAGAIRSIFRG